jgi:hypothetical protein
MNIPRIYKRINLRQINQSLDYFDIFLYQNNIIVNINKFAKQFKYSSASYLIRYYKTPILYTDTNKYISYIDICEILQRGRHAFLRQTYALVSKELGFNVITSACKEANICENLIELLNDKSIKFQKQFSCGQYKIDMYLPKENIVIEINENGHANRNITYENTRKEFITNKLKCTYHIINPDEPGFSIYKMNKNLEKILYYNAN